MSEGEQKDDRRLIRFAKYEQPLDLTGVDLISLSGASREKVRAVMPGLREPEEMAKGWAATSQLETMTGEIADEVHIFARATQGRFRLKRILLREGEVIDLQFG
jgi:hypothetical protein